MKFLFVDETYDSSHPNYLGLCFALIDGTKYPLIKKTFFKHLEKYDWDTDIEFKGRWIFSASKGCENVPVEERIKLTKEIIDLNTSSKTRARIKFLYVYTEQGSGSFEYRKLFAFGLGQVLPKAPKGMGKNLLAIYCDRREDVKAKDIRHIAEPILRKKHYILFEDPHFITSTVHTVGICVADMVAYLMSRVNVIQVDRSLFDDLTSERAQTNMRLQKVLTSKRLINAIKRMDVYKAIKKTE